MSARRQGILAVSHGEMSERVKRVEALCNTGGEGPLTVAELKGAILRALRGEDEVLSPPCEDYSYGEWLR